MRKTTTWVLAASVLVYLAGLGLDVMDIDAAQYASISREMMETGNFLHVFDKGHDYLDKPPLLFWMSAFSMKLFGANQVAYRLPSFLFSMLALWSTYKFSRLFYNEERSRIAVIVLATCQGFFLMNHDIRTDTLLLSFVIFSIWQLAKWYTTGKFINFLFGCIGIGCGMLTKGPIALLVPVFAFGSHILLKRDFSKLFKWEYISGLIIVAIVLLPMSIGLYQQFDQHPEKMVNGKSGVSGLRFFYWTQSFGRITGESVWDNNAGFFYLFKNMLWSFLPWIFFFVSGVIRDFIMIIKNKFRLPGGEGLAIGGFTLTYISLALSHYQLPHYIFVAFPLAAIVTSGFLYDLLYKESFGRLRNFFTRTHVCLFFLLWAGLSLITWYSLPFSWFQKIIIASLALFFIILAIQEIKNKLLVMAVYTIVAINLSLNTIVYPRLFSYQLGSMAGKWLNEQNIANKTFIYKFEEYWSLHFYAKHIVQHKDDISLFKPGDYILTTVENLPELENSTIKFEVVYKNDNYPVSTLKIGFFIPEKRTGLLKPYVIVLIKNNVTTTAQLNKKYL